MRIKANNVHIRPIDQGDALAVLNWENNPSVWGVSQNDSPYVLEDIQNLILALQDVRTAMQTRYIIALNSDGRPLGTVDLASIDFNQGSAWVGVLIADEADRNKGFGEEAIRLIEEIALQLDVSRLYAKIHGSNQSSLRLFEKCGYQLIENDRKTQNEHYIDKVIYLKCLRKS